MPDSLPSAEAPAARPASRWMRTGLVILGVSMVFWALLPAAAFFPLSTGKKAAAAGAIFIIAEVTFWLGALLAGKEVVQKYQDRLNPFRRGKG